jgi:hypothetical protein
MEKKKERKKERSKERKKEIKKERKKTFWNVSQARLNKFNVKKKQARSKRGLNEQAQAVFSVES